VKKERIYIEGELFLTLEVVAKIYEVKTVWLREICDYGLLSSSTQEATEVCIAAVELDRVATIVRLHRSLSIDLETISLLLEAKD
jgi:hypothetical protein